MNRISLITFTLAAAALFAPLMTRDASAQRTRQAGRVYEVEALESAGKTSVSGGNVVAQPMSGFGQGWSGNAQLFWSGGETGAVLDLILDVTEEANYAVELHMTRAPDYARLRIQVDGKDVAATFDGYSPTVVPSGPFQVGSFKLGPGPRKVSFMIVGKNEKSTGFLAGIDLIRLNRLESVRTAGGISLGASTVGARSSILGANIDQGLIRVVPTRAGAKRTDRSMQIQSPPNPLSLADKQRILRSLLVSLDQQNKANPGQNLGMWFPSSTPPKTLSASSTALTLTPRDWLIQDVADLSFFYANILGHHDQTPAAAWFGADPEDENPPQALLLSLKASKGQTYLLVYDLAYVPLMGEGAYQMYKGVNKNMHVEIKRSGGPKVEMEMGLTPGTKPIGGHILVPFFASTTGWYEIMVDCKVPWIFWSVEVNTLTGSEQ